MEDESHSSIRRTYTSPNEQSSKRHFCGFCGTPLSYWSESTPAEASYISLTLGSLAGSDLRDLEDSGLLPREALEDADNEKEKIENIVPFAESNILNEQGNEGLPWFETLIQGSRLSNVQRSWRHSQSRNGRFKVEWEIVEWTDDGTEGNPSPAKRKIGEVAEDEPMV